MTSMPRSPGSPGSEGWPCDLAELSDLERLLLTHDGSLTRMLEVLYRERVELIKLRQRTLQTTQPIELLEMGRGELVVERSVLLRGESSASNYVYATSVIAPHRLEARFRHEVLCSDTPLGRLFNQHQLEIFKEVVEYRDVRADRCAEHFQIDAGARLLSRTCRLRSRGVAIMVIAEYFSPHLPRLIDRRRIRRDFHAQASWSAPKGERLPSAR